MRGVGLLEELDRPLVVRLRLVRPDPRGRHHGGTLLELAAAERIGGQLDRAFVCALCLEIRAEGRCPLSRAHKRFGDDRPECTTTAHQRASIAEAALTFIA